MTQEIIVYRNPAEKAFWDLLSSGSMVPIFAGIIVFFVVFLAANRLITRGRTFHVPGWQTNLSLAIGALAGVATIYKLWI